MSLPKSTIHQEPDFQLTRITSYNPPVVTKEFALDEQGKMQKTVTASVYSGLMERKDLATPAQFCELLSSLTPNQCLVYGITGHDAIKLMTQKEWDDYKNKIIKNDNNCKCYEVPPILKLLVRIGNKICE